MAKQDSIEVDGTVVEALSNACATRERTAYHRPYLRQDAYALYQDPRRGPRESRNESVRPHERTYLLPLQVIINRDEGIRNKE